MNGGQRRRGSGGRRLGTREGKWKTTGWRLACSKWKGRVASPVCFPSLLPLLSSDRRVRRASTSVPTRCTVRTHTHTCARKRRMHYLPLCHNGELWSWVSGSPVWTALWFLPAVTNNLIGGSTCANVRTWPRAHARSRKLHSPPLKIPPLSYCTLLHHINKYHGQGSLINRAAASWLMEFWWTLFNNELSAVDGNSCSDSLDILTLVKHFQEHFLRRCSTHIRSCFQYIFFPLKIKG